MEEKLKILVVDDDQVDRKAMRHTLTKPGLEMELFEVNDSNSALAAFGDNSYDCVFLDYRLLQGDGLSLIQKLRSREIKVPLVVLTDREEEQKVVEWMEAGATDYIYKSWLSSDILVKVLRNAIRVHKAEMHVAWKNQQLQENKEQLTRKNQEIEAQKQQIEEQKLKLNEAARIKSQFQATVSHELRTPMNAIIGFAQLLLRPKTGELSHPQKDMVERILKNSKNLLMLLNEILDFSKLEAGGLDIKPEIFDLVKVINATIAEMQSLAEKKNLTLLLKNELSNYIVFNDPTRVRQVLTNLLSNAIKFTESGGVAVEVKELPGSRVAISVCDTGIGIAPTDIKYIFQPFRQVDQSTTRKYSGTGLGLPVVNALVQKMGGKITVESKLGEGSMFRIELPRQISSLIQSGGEEKSKDHTDWVKKNHHSHHIPLLAQEGRLR